MSLEGGADGMSESPEMDVDTASQLSPPSASRSLLTSNPRLSQSCSLRGSQAADESSQTTSAIPLCSRYPARARRHGGRPAADDAPPRVASVHELGQEKRHSHRGSGAWPGAPRRASRRKPRAHSAGSANPACFPRLLRNPQHHLAPPLFSMVNLAQVSHHAGSWRPNHRFSVT